MTSQLNYEKCLIRLVLALVCPLSLCQLELFQKQTGLSGQAYHTSVLNGSSVCKLRIPMSGIRTRSFVPCCWNIHRWRPAAWRWPNRLIAHQGKNAVARPDSGAGSSWTVTEASCAHPDQCAVLLADCDHCDQAPQQLVAAARLITMIHPSAGSDLQWNVELGLRNPGGTEILMGQPVDLEKIHPAQKILEDLTLRDQRATD